MKQGLECMIVKSNERYSRRERYRPSNGSIDFLYHFEQMFKMMEKAIDLARESMDKRLDGMNEFRESLKDQSSKYVTRWEVFAFATLIASMIGIALKFVNLAPCK